MATVRVPAERTCAGTVAAMAELAGWVGITVVGIGGAVVVVDAPVVVVELLELLEQAEAMTARVPRATAAAAFCIPRVGVRTGVPPGIQGCDGESPKCATPVRSVCTPRERQGAPDARGVRGSGGRSG